MDSVKEITSLRELLGWGSGFLKEAGIENPRRNAEQLLGHLLGLSRIDLYLSERRSLKPMEISDYQTLLKKRSSRVPLQYLTGRTFFLEDEFLVDGRVLIPRPETELLVEEAKRRLTAVNHPLIVDVGTGCGNIAVSLAKHLKANVWATDISKEALVVAKTNAERLGVRNRVTFLQGDLLAPLTGLGLKGKIDLVISNPPYIVRKHLADLAAEIRLHEPVGALDGGEDGLRYYRKIIPEAGPFLKEGGFLLLELGEGLAEAVSSLVETQGSCFKRPRILEDLAGLKRIFIAAKR